MPLSAKFLYRSFWGANIKFGVKLWSTNADLVIEAEGLIESDVFQYVELTAIPGTDIAPFLVRDIPYVIHAASDNQGVNFADRSKREYNIKAINDCIEWADRLDARYMIFHPGFGSMDATIDLLSHVDDPRVLVENMPRVGLNGEDMIAYDPEQISHLLMGRFGFCLDINHAIKASVSLNVDYRKLLDEFLKYNPEVMHISDGHMTSEKDEHLRPGDGDYDFEFIMRRIRESDAFLTLETPRRSGTLEDAVGDLRAIKKYM